MRIQLSPDNSCIPLSITLTVTEKVSHLLHISVERHYNYDCN